MSNQNWISESLRSFAWSSFQISVRTGQMFINNFPPGALIHLGMIDAHKLINVPHFFLNHINNAPISYIWVLWLLLTEHISICESSDNKFIFRNRKSFHLINPQVLLFQSIKYQTQMLDPQLHGRIHYLKTLWYQKAFQRLSFQNNCYHFHKADQQIILSL